MLPTTITEFAHALRINESALRDMAAEPPYKLHRIRKKSGGWRTLAEPAPELMAVQRWIHRRVTSRLPVHDAAHGSLPGRSIATNALVHAGAGVLVKLDVRDFFPSIRTFRVGQEFIFRGGFAPSLAWMLAGLCTASIQGIPRSLPQGAPTSPSLANATSMRLDLNLARAARLSGARYTRYVDDLTFSFARTLPSRFVEDVAAIVELEGFEVAEEKTQVLYAHDRQAVTGLVVNASEGDPTRPPREFARRLRAAVHQAEKFGASEARLAQLEGLAAFMMMTNPTKGQLLFEQIRQMRKQR
jgi:RNA-directed DNA polymerase